MLLSIITAEQVLRLCEISTIILGVVGVTTLIAQSLASNIVSDRQKTLILKLEETSAIQQERAAKAEAELVAVKNRLSWRPLTPKFNETLARSAKAAAQIVFEPDSVECHQLATNIFIVLEKLGWKVEPPKTRIVPPIGTAFDDSPLVFREGGVAFNNFSGVSLVVRTPDDHEIPEPIRPALDGLRAALEASGLEAAIIRSNLDFSAPPEGYIRIVIGSRL